MLPLDIQNARIMTFSYNADVVNLWSVASQSAIGNHAQNLVGALARLREETGTVCSCSASFLTPTKGPIRSYNV